MRRHDTDSAGGQGIKRRAVLRGVAALGAISTVGAGVAMGQNGNPQEECDCPDGVTGKYEFDSDSCEFVFEKGADLVTITGYTNKDGEDCEPVTVSYEVEPGYVVTRVCSFGGTDNHTDSDPTGGTYESDLTTPGGQRAAISNITFCVEESAECPDGLELKYDIEGEWDPEDTQGIEFVGGDSTGATFYSPFPVDVYVFGGNTQNQQHSAVAGEFEVTTVDRGDHPGGDADISHVWFVCPGAEEPTVGNENDSGKGPGGGSGPGGKGGKGP